jgi:hypothetical protein
LFSPFHSAALSPAAVTYAFACRLISGISERTVEDDADGGWTETTTDAVTSSSGGGSAVDDAVDCASGALAAVCVADEVDLDDIPDADDDSAAVSVSIAPHSTACLLSYLHHSQTFILFLILRAICSRAPQVVVAARDDGAADQVVLERTRT